MTYTTTGYATNNCELRAPRHQGQKQQQDQDVRSKRPNEKHTFPAPVPPAIPKVINGFVIIFLAMGVNNIQNCLTFALFLYLVLNDDVY